MRVYVLGLVVLLCTAGAAAAWSPAPTPTQDTLRSVAFLDSQTGLAVGTGHTILRTTDGGVTWTETMGGLFGFGWYDVAWVTPTSAIAVGANAIFQPLVAWSHDGGQTWAPQSFYINNNEGTLHGVTVSGPFVIIAATLWDGTGVIITNSILAPALQTPWVPVLTTGAPLVAVATDGPRVAAAGAHGAVYVSENMGLNWLPRLTPTDSFLWDVSVDGTTLGAVGAAGTALHSMDAGITWTTSQTGTNAVLYGITHRGDGRAIAVGEAGTLLESTDNGLTWHVTASGTNARLLDVDADGILGRAWAVGSSGTVIRNG